MADNRLTRELTNRATAQRPTKWSQAELLPEPDKQPGYTYRWIRVSLLTNSDPRNISSKFREGWEPVTIEEQPKFRFMVDDSSRFKDNIEIGGLLLCKVPEEFMQQRAAHFEQVSSKQTEAVDNNLMRQSDPRMPLFQERRSTVSFGKGT
jgi:hypothetical protein